MILGIGTDMVSIDRIASLLESSGDRFINRIMSDAEKLRIKEFGRGSMGISYIAKRFAAKEAFSKATGLGIGRGVNFNDISVLNDENGKPFLQITGREDFLKTHFGVADYKIHISISDEVDYAIAYCIIEQV